MMADLPSLTRHHRGTLTLLRQYAALAGTHPALQSGLTLLGPPPTVRGEDTLKYDVYLCRAPKRQVWGFTINDRHEPGALPQRLRTFATGLGDYNLDALAQLRAQLTGAGQRLTVGVAFDHPDGAPRLKAYLQEERWETGIGSVRQVLSALQAIDSVETAPTWLSPDTTVGVVCLNLHADGRVGGKLYLGAATVDPLIRAAPASVRALGAVMRARCSWEGGYYYLTCRLDPGRPIRYAVNKVFNVQRARRERGGWRDVVRLFRHAGQADVLRELHATWATIPGLDVVPTAIAVEAAGQSVDLYTAAWRAAVGGDRL